MPNSSSSPPFSPTSHLPSPPLPTNNHRRASQSQKEDEGRQSIFLQRSTRSFKDASSVSPESTLDEETDIETNLYFPTFARRGSSPKSQSDSRRFSLKSRQHESAVLSDEDEELGRQSDARIAKKTTELCDGGLPEDSEENIFELDEEENDDANPYTFDGDYSMKCKKNDTALSAKRGSDQSAYSHSTKDLGMVWDEEDEGNEDTELESTDSSPSDATMGLIRSDSVSTRKGIHLSNSPRWSKTPHIPSAIDAYRAISIPALPFARKTRRPSEINTSPTFQHWQAGSTQCKSKSVGLPVQASQSFPASNQVRESFQSVRSKVQETKSGRASPRLESNRSRSSTLALSTLVTTGESLVPAKSRSQLDLVGRKRSMTDPLASKWSAH
ncbi:hypothetical protein CBS101457_000865 [Exobasidium rhododendri]|nr:hypothetical protein CBS101457_000865 [Exobasidium rhododendri]